MTKIQISPGQESLLEQPSEAPAPFDVVAYLNANEGVINLEDLPNFTYDPERPVRYIDFIGSIGVALAEKPPKSPDWDPELEIHGVDFEKAAPDELDKGLYFNLNIGERRPDVVVVGKYASSLSLPGGRPRGEGVAVTGEEFRTIARSPEDLANHASAITEGANTDREPSKKLDDETLINTAGRSIAHAMRDKKQALLKLDSEVRRSRQALWVVSGLATWERDLEWPTGELDNYRLDAARAIHGALKVSSLQRHRDSMRKGQSDYGTTVRQAMNRAVTFSMHRGEPDDIARSVAHYTKWAGYYMDAKRVKIYQSLSWCKAVFDANKYFLKTKRTESSDRPIA